MAQVRPGPGALLLVSLLLLGSGHAVLVVPVSTPEQLLDALVAATAPGAPSDSVLELQEDVALTQAAAANYTLPFIIPSNHTLTIRAGERWQGTPPTRRSVPLRAVSRLVDGR